MSQSRDVAAFEERAATYDDGRLGRFHHEVAQRVVAIVESTSPLPQRVLDVGCGTGYLLSVLAQQYPAAPTLVGLDASPSMTDTARRRRTDRRIEIVNGTAERLPFADDEFDLVVSTTSFDHWHDQAGGLRECARVLDPGGVLVIADLFSPLLGPTLIGTRRHKARTRARAERLLADAGLRPDGWHKVNTLIAAVVARPGRPG